MDFKLAAELSKLMHVIAYTHDVDEDAHKYHKKKIFFVKDCTNLSYVI